VLLHVVSLAKRLRSVEVHDRAPEVNAATVHRDGRVGDGSGSYTGAVPVEEFSVTRQFDLQRARHAEATVGAGAVVSWRPHFTVAVETA
jgi:hypothetical protein